MPVLRWGMRPLSIALVTLLLTAFAAEANKKTAFASTPSVAMRTGDWPTEEVKIPLQMRLVARGVDGTAEISELRMAGAVGWSRDEDVVVTEAGTKTFCFLASNGSSNEATVFVRRPRSEESRPLALEAYVPGAPSQASRHYQIAVDARGGASDEQVIARFHDAASNYFYARRSSGAFYAFAAARLGHRVDAERPRRANAEEFSRLMETSTGMTSLQETLQADRPLFGALGREPATIPLSSVAAVPLTKHPFAELLKKLRRPVSDEPLSRAVPADFYYLRLADLSLLFRLTDQLDAWGTPAANVLDRVGEERALGDRYLTELGLSRGPLSRALGPTVVAELAITGSDPYLREGSDVTALFRVKERALFNAGLDHAIGEHSRKHGALIEHSVQVDGIEVRIAEAADQTVRQHRATIGDIEVISNSLGALRRVLAAFNGHAPRLADEPDFRYMMARDGRNERGALAFLGDRFVASVVGPRQKILEARRQLALAELTTPAYSALLYGWLEGQSPASLGALLNSGLLKKDDLRHADGAEIDFEPGRAPRSRYGTPARLLSLIDWPELQMVTASEKAAYRAFADSYQHYWRQYLDPIAVRINLEEKEKGAVRLAVDLRVLPLIDGTDYRHLDSMVGRTRISVPALDSGLRAVVGIGANASLRREMREMASGGFMGQRFEVDWLGDWGLFGVEDQTPLFEAVVATSKRSSVERPSRNSEEDAQMANLTKQLPHLPIYAAVGIRQVAGAAIFLAEAKKLATDAAPGMVSWSESKVYRGAHIVRVASGNWSVYYTLSDSFFAISLSQLALEHVIDQQSGGEKMQAGPSLSSALGQFVFEWSMRPKTSLSNALAFALEDQVLRGGVHSRDRAEALLRGAPAACATPEGFRRLALAYEGAIPVSPDGGVYLAAKEGVRDSIRGSRFAPRWPAVPVPGSPVEHLLSAINQFRGEVAFDEEPRVGDGAPLIGLHVKATLGLRN
jgi:hypothetical protein